MKEYIKPEAELITFESEDVTTSLLDITFDGGDLSNTLDSDEGLFQ